MRQSSCAFPFHTFQGQRTLSSPWPSGGIPGAPAFGRVLRCSRFHGSRVKEVPGAPGRVLRGRPSTAPVRAPFGVETAGPPSQVTGRAVNAFASAWRSCPSHGCARRPSTRSAVAPTSAPAWWYFTRGYGRLWSGWPRQGEGGASWPLRAASGWPALDPGATLRAVASALPGGLPPGSASTLLATGSWRPRLLRPSAISRYDRCARCNVPGSGLSAVAVSYRPAPRRGREWPWLYSVSDG
jgi:hypothetical protein